MWCPAPGRGQADSNRIRPRLDSPSIFGANVKVVSK